MTIKSGEVVVIHAQHQTQNSFPRFMRRAEAARYIRENYGIPCVPSTLATIGGGPAFRRAGRFPVYDIGDLSLWAEHRLTKLVHSTSELLEVQRTR